MTWIFDRRILETTIAALHIANDTKFRSWCLKIDFPTVEFGCRTEGKFIDKIVQVNCLPIRVVFSRSRRSAIKFSLKLGIELC